MSVEDGGSSSVPDDASAAEPQDGSATDGEGRSGDDAGELAQQGPPSCSEDVWVEQDDIGGRDSPLALSLGDARKYEWLFEHGLPSLQDEDCFSLSLETRARVNVSVGGQPSSPDRMCVGEPMLEFYRGGDLSAPFTYEHDWGNSPCPGHAVEFEPGEYIACIRVEKEDEPNRPWSMTTEAAGEPIPSIQTHLYVALMECGDGETVAEEECDDGNRSDGDGCSSTCTQEPGYTCSRVYGDCSGEDFRRGGACCGMGFPSECEPEST
jgi:cysteine-rich repeat protein